MRRKSQRFAVGAGALAAVGLLAGAGGELAAAPRVKRVVERVNVTSTGAEATGGAASAMVFSADGRFVAFNSTATNLVTGDTNATQDIFVRDRVSGTTERVTVSSAEAQADNQGFDPSISADGRFVVFRSDAANLVAGDTNALSDVFLRDRQAGTTTRISVSSTGVQSSAHCFTPRISADGRFVTFHSSANNLVTGDTNGIDDVFLRDLQANTTVRISLTTGGAEATGGISFNAAISANGQFVAFQSAATNLVTGDTNSLTDIFVRDRTAGTTTRVSTSTAGAQTTGGNSTVPLITADGRFVFFQSSATNLVSGDTNGGSDVFVRDRTAGTTELVSANGDGAAGNAGSGPFAISADGNLVAFLSTATNLVPSIPFNTNAVYLRNRAAGETARVNLSPTGDPANSVANFLAISGDGRFVAFTSPATNLVPQDLNALPDLFIVSFVAVTGTRIAVFRPSTQEWFARDDDGSTSSVQFGGPGDVPMPADYLGLGFDQIAIFRPSSREWFVRADDGRTVGPMQFGAAGVLPVPGDYLGAGRAQLTVWGATAGRWAARTDAGQFVEFLIGTTGDVPIPADYLGLGKLQPAVFRPSTREWILHNPNTGAQTVIQFGGPNDQSVPGDYFGLGRDSIAIFRPTTGEWFIRLDNGQTVRIPFGGNGDIPVPGDYLEQGRLQLAIFRPSTREWFIREHNLNTVRVQYGGPGDQPLPVRFRPRL